MGEDESSILVMKLLHIVGARPNFMKAAPVIHVLDHESSVHQMLIHTGQHYDANMSEVFFRELDIPEPDLNLEVGSGTHGRQTAQIMMRFEEVVLENRPDLVLVYGDVNSTAATAMVCAKLWIPVGHVEAGLRSFDRSMPEEINRVITDQIADVLFTPSRDGDTNLLAEGVSQDKIHFVGNVMIDTLIHLLPKAETHWETDQIREWRERKYILVTIHRPSNVDEPAVLTEIMKTLGAISERLPVLFPVHPRTAKALKRMGYTKKNSNFHLMDPIGYLDFLALQQNATAVITDSGGIQEETTYLGVPCLTVRKNTERPVTLTTGTNILVGQDMEKLRIEMDRILSGESKKGALPPLWDGHASARIAQIIASYT